MPTIWLVPACFGAPHRPVPGPAGERKGGGSTPTEMWEMMWPLKLNNRKKMKKGTNDSLYLCLIKRQPKKPTEYMIKALTSMNFPVPITTTRAYWGDAGYCKLPKKLSPKKEMPVGTK